MKILISGAGIAGPSVACWLQQHGFQRTIVERAPCLRTGGYIIDFRGAGFDVADRMGLVPEVLHSGYQIRRSERSTGVAGAWTDSQFAPLIV